MRYGTNKGSMEIKAAAAFTSLTRRLDTKPNASGVVEAARQKTALLSEVLFR